MKWERIARLRFRIKAEEGLRVGGSGGGLEIGGLIDANLTAIRNPQTNEFYIPGSSLKGKLRSVLEKEAGKAEGGQPCRCGQVNCKICTVFGAHMNPRAECAPTRIVVRDAPLTEASRAEFKARVAAGQAVAEEKTENIVNRKTGTAEHPRTGERVLPGTEFGAEIILHIYEGDDAKGMSDFIRHGLGIVQEASSVGASGSRGSGKVKFLDVNVEMIDVASLRV